MKLFLKSDPVVSEQMNDSDSELDIVEFWQKYFLLVFGEIELRYHLLY